MIKATTHLHFNGRCREALEFYAQTLGGKITFATAWGETPVAKDVGADWQSKILHASLEFGGQTITGDDAPAPQYAKPQGFGVLLSFDDVAAAKKVFDAFAANGTAHMPFGETFWAKAFGMVTDEFGIPWMVNVSQR